MDKTILFTLLHDAWGEGSNESLRLSMMRLTDDVLAEGDAKALADMVPEIPIEKWQAWRTYYSPVRYDLRAELLDQLGVQIMLYADDAYPEALRAVYRPPSILYIKGHFELANLNIAMVGSRKATAYGKNVAYSISKALSNENVRIISGLAKGIDVNSHKGAIEGPGGTIAVLGCGIDKIYPRQNASMYDAILSHPKSAIVSEWTLGSGPLDWHFPNRNRIIAGLAEGLVVVEASKKSGSLISANYALEYGKEVFAVPGMITSPESVGCHRLIKDGAKLIAQPSDILDEFGQLCLFEETKTEEKTRSFSKDEKRVYDALTNVPQSIEDICTACKLPINTVSGILLEFELEDIVIQEYGRQYSKIN